MSTKFWLVNAADHWIMIAKTEYWFIFHTFYFIFHAFSFIFRAFWSIVRIFSFVNFFVISPYVILFTVSLVPVSLVSGAVVKTLDTKSHNGVNCILPHPYEDLIASCGLGHEIQIWSPHISWKSLLTKIASYVSLILFKRGFFMCWIGYL